MAGFWYIIANMNTLTVKRNNDVTLNITTDFDITGYSVFFTVKETLDDDPTDAEAVIAKDVTVAGANSATLALSATDTDIVNSQYFYDLAFIDTDGKRINSTRGIFVISDVVGNRSA